MNGLMEQRNSCFSKGEMSCYSAGNMRFQRTKKASTDHDHHPSALCSPSKRE